MIGELLAATGFQGSDFELRAHFGRGWLPGCRFELILGAKTPKDLAKTDTDVNQRKANVKRT